MTQVKRLLVWIFLMTYNDTTYTPRPPTSALLAVGVRGIRARLPPAAPPLELVAGVGDL